MLVRELIEKLQEMDQDAVVKYWSDDCHGGANWEVEMVEQRRVVVDYQDNPIYEVYIE